LNRVTFEIWDTAGQERYRSLTPRFFKHASAAVFVFDLTSRNSLTPLSYYVERLRQACPEGSVMISLIGNKTDLEDDRQVSLEDALAAKETIGAQFYRECSAKAGAGVVEIFKDLASAPTIPLIGTYVMDEIVPATQDQSACSC
jgi:small GTP-binding protein